MKLPEQTDYLTLMKTIDIPNRLDIEGNPFYHIPERYRNFMHPNPDPIDTQGLKAYIYLQKKNGRDKDIFASLCDNLNILSFRDHKYIRFLVARQYMLFSQGKKIVHFLCKGARGGIEVASTCLDTYNGWFHLELLTEEDAEEQSEVDDIEHENYYVVLYKE